MLDLTDIDAISFSAMHGALGAQIWVARRLEKAILATRILSARIVVGGAHSRPRCPLLQSRRS
eukprot:3576446-Prorocentrum_lima.AAC.1